MLSHCVGAELAEEFPHCKLQFLSPSPFDTLRQVLTDASRAASTAAATSPPSAAPVVLCCGTFFIMSDVRRALGLPHPVDPVAVNEQSLHATVAAKGSAQEARARGSAVREHVR